jgi:hypothetical protein
MTILNEIPPEFTLVATDGMNTLYMNIDTRDSFVRKDADNTVLEAGNEAAWPQVCLARTLHLINPV